MTEAKKAESQLISASAFVEGGLQDVYDEACSICLEEFCESDPSVVIYCTYSFFICFTGILDYHVFSTDGNLYALYSCVSLT